MIATGHVHRWRIATPNGPQSEGTCECGSTRQFWNAQEEDQASTWAYQRRAKRPSLRQEERA